MSTANRRPPSWLLVVALVAGVGVGLWAGLSLREADQGRPPERGERFGSPPAGGAAEGGGLAASPTGPLERPATRASAGRPEPSVPEGLTLLEQRVGQGAVVGLERFAVAAFQCFGVEIFPECLLKRLVVGAA